MNREIIGRTGATYLMVMAVVAKQFTMNPRMLTVKAGSAAWLVTLLAGLVAWPGYLLLSALLRRFPGQSLGQISKQVLGKWLGMLLCLIYSGYFIFLSGLFMRQFEASFRIAVLPRTPASALMLMFSAGVVFLVFKGVEAMGRMATYLFPLLLFLLVAMGLGSIRLVDLRQLTPFFGYGISTTLLLPFPESSVYGEILVLGAFAGMLRAADVHPAGKWAFWAAVLVMTMSYVVLLGVFPYPSLSRLQFPILELSRAIQVGEFLQRIEAVFVMVWFFFSSFKVATAVACAAVFFRDLAGLADYRPVAFALVLIAYTIAFLPEDPVVVAALDSYTLRTWTWPVSYLLPAITLGVAIWRGKRGAVADAASG